MCCEDSLLHAEHGSRESCDATQLKLSASLKTLPCSRNLDAYPLGVKVWGYMPEVGQDPWKPVNMVP